jgi:hypothetical protein
MDHWILQKPAVLYHMMCLSDIASPFSANEWRTCDITNGLNDVAKQPTNDDVMERRQNRYRELGRPQHQSFINSRRDALTKELYHGGIRFNADLEI